MESKITTRLKRALLVPLYRRFLDARRGSVWGDIETLTTSAAISRTTYIEEKLHVWRSAISEWANDPRFGSAEDWPTVSCVVLPRPEINAFACSETNQPNAFQIIIHEGLVNAVVGFFQETLANPVAFPAVGCSFAEEASHQKSQTLRQLQDRLAKSNFRTPRDPVRVSFANQLSDIALRFAFEHELSHILLGHVGAFCPNLRMSESEGPPSVSPSIRQAIEMHADEAALHRCFYWIMDAATMGRKVDSLPLWAQTNHGLFVDFFASIYCLFQLLAASASADYPSSVERQIRLAVILDHFIRHSGAKMDFDAFQIVGMAFQNVDLYMEKVFNIDWSLQTQESHRILSTEMDSRIAPFSKAIVNLFPRLRPHAYVELN